MGSNGHGSGRKNFFGFWNPRLAAAERRSAIEETDPGRNEGGRRDSILNRSIALSRRFVNPSSINQSRRTRGFLSHPAGAFAIISIPLEINYCEVSSWT